MTLQLRITKAPDGIPLSQPSHTFGEQGGTIGRGAGNTWVLADPERILSSRHCELVFQNNHYQIIDLSTNGTFLNQSSEPLGKGSRASLTHGDSISLGDYSFAVEMSAACTPDPLSPFDDLPGAAPPPASSGTAFGEDPFGPGDSVLVDSGASVDPLQALDGLADSDVAPEPWTIGETAASASPAAEAIAWPEAAPESLIPDDWLDEVQAASSAAEPESMPAPVEVASPVPKPAVAKIPPQTESAGGPVDALIEAMGLDSSRLSPADRAELSPLVGRMIREVIAGLMQVLRSRASIKNEFRMNVTTIQPVENNPLKFSADVDEAIDNIFVRRSQAYKAPLDAIHEGFQEIAEHQLAMIAGMRSAFEHMLEDFDPHRLQAAFDKQKKPGAFGSLQSGRYWRQYQAHYETLNDNIDRSFQQIFGDEFVQAYQDQLRSLAASRSK
ncbi:type VI secretion system-associated FHA domain protein TagH [Marinimicrobium alkaliphilum]|uniref:type VI secretion system-associated FHA domain protein TagH n=1 Tax=Marinimicrobium alkaliphilum TaxID=2202654 RepID=UPI000DBA6CB7|nr:type VI secretion system-associated FHA domain protein TagH [Marinimicrobium alkaliphilum]